MSTLTLNPSKDNFLYGPNFHNLNYGQLPYIYIMEASSNIARIAMEFDLSSLPDGSTLNTALLYLYVYAYGFPDFMAIKAHKLNRIDWLEGSGSGNVGDSCWDNYDVGKPWTTAGGDYTVDASDPATTPNAVGWWTWDVKTLVQNAKAASQPLELLLKYEDEVTNEKDMYMRSNQYVDDPALRPKLIIDYDAPPASHPDIASLHFFGDRNIVKVLRDRI